MTSNKKNFDSIPGTYVFTKEHSRKGYHLNMFCMSLNVPANREAFRDDEQGYIERFSMTLEQKEAVINRDWLSMIQLGGNIYYIFKIAIFDGFSMQKISGLMSNISEEDFKEIMVTGGKDEMGNPRHMNRNIEENDE